MNGDIHTELELKLRAECERGFQIGPKTGPDLWTPGATITFSPHRPLSVAPTGEPFTELIRVRPPAVDDDAAYELALTAFRNYASKQSGTLYWRTYPEIERGRFYMRLLISDRPLASHEEMS